MSDHRPRAAVTYVGHATVTIEIAGVKIITDPVLTNRLKHLRRVGAPAADFDPATVDVIVLSHQHHDHLHPPSLRRLPSDALVVVPCGLGARVAKIGFTRIVELAIGDSVLEGVVKITAVPAVHDDRRHPGVPRVAPVGYLVEADGWTVYFPGDTELFREMVDITADLALLPVWGWGPTLGTGHLDPRGAAEAIGLLGTPTAIPVHWGTFWPYHVRRNDRLVLPPKEFAQAVRDRRLDADVIEVPPGGRILV